MADNTGEALAAVEAFDPDDPETIAGLNAVAMRGDVDVPALRPAVEQSDPARRWAALYLVGLLAGDTEADKAVLAAALDDPEPELRVIAAGALSGLGDVRALPLLIEGLGLDTPLPYSKLGRPTAELAREALEAYTDQSFAEPAAWEAWWDRVKDTIRWNGERYVVP